jgi:hypothetical protein
MSDESTAKLIEGLNYEYYKLLGIVGEFDKNLLIIKGWGVTFSLVALAEGFKEKHYGIFLIAFISGLAFWIVEGVTKRHQMRFYVRMREIEVIISELTKSTLSDGTKVSTPQIDWGWKIAKDYFLGESSGVPPLPIRYEKSPAYSFVWFFPHVAMPHVVIVIAGGILFILGIFGRLEFPL